MVHVNVTVYKDMSAIYVTGCTRSVSGDSIVYQVDKVYLYDSPTDCNENPNPYMMLLKIFDPTWGIMWIDETAQSFADLIGEADNPPIPPPTFQFTVGDGGANTPLDGTNVYSNPALAGQSDLKVEKNGFGTLTEGVDYTILPAGGFTLVGPAIFTNGETYFIWDL